MISKFTVFLFKVGDPPSSPIFKKITYMLFDSLNNGITLQRIYSNWNTEINWIQY